MKNYLLLLFFLPAFLSAQNWIPLNLQDKYNYQIDSGDYISHTLWIDSVEVINGDSVFYLNRIVKDCPTCDTITGNPNKYKIANQGQFLQKKMMKMADDTYRFEGNQTFYLRPKAGLNEFWIFDSLQNTVATVTNVSEQEIFGNLDSVKTIALSNNSTIVLSKNHGLLQFQQASASYAIKGIEGRDLGELVPDFWDYYDFEVGDVFQYEGQSREFEGSLWQVDWIRKYKITSKEVNSSEIIYTIDEIKVIWYTTSNASWYCCNSESTREWILKDTAIHYTNQFNRALVFDQEVEALCGENPIDRVYQSIKLYRDASDQKVTKDMSCDSDFDYPPEAYMFESEALDTLIQENCAASFFYRFKEGLGVEYRQWNRFEYGEYEKLIAYVKDGDTTGIISPDEDLLLANDAFQIDLNISIHPNPSKGEYFLTFDNPKQLFFEVYNLNGQTIYKNESPPFANQLEIDIQNEPSGIYFLKIKSGDSFQTFKLMKQ